MKLTKIDLSQIVAVGHNNGQLGLLIDRGDQIEYIEVPAPVAAYDGLQQVSNFANPRAISGRDQYLTTVRNFQPLDRCEENRFLFYKEESENAEPLIELECCDQDGYEYYPVDLESEEYSSQTNSCDQLLNFRVPGYSY